MTLDVRRGGSLRWSDHSLQEVTAIKALHGLLVAGNQIHGVHLKDGGCHEGEVPDGTSLVRLLHPLHLDEGGHPQPQTVCLQQVLSRRAEHQALDCVAVMVEGLAESKDNL